MMLIYPDTYLNDYKPKPSPWDIAQELEQELTDEEREDLILPGTVVRDADGHVVGCIDFSRV